MELAVYRLYCLGDERQCADEDRANDEEVPDPGDSVGGIRLLENPVKALLEGNAAAARVMARVVGNGRVQRRGNA